MATYNLNALGLKCPQPVLKVAIKAKEMQSGDLLEIQADCPSFADDIKAWCNKTGKILLVCADEGGGKFKAQVQF